MRAAYIYTTCRHACFGVYASSVQLCNTSRYVTRRYLSTCECSHQTHVGQPGHVNTPRHAQSVMGPECSNNHEGSELCNIASGHPINSAQRVLNNTEVKERNNHEVNLIWYILIDHLQYITFRGTAPSSEINLILLTYLLIYLTIY